MQFIRRFAAGGVILGSAMGFSLRMSYCRKEQKGKTMWQGNGPNYSGGDWAEELFQGALVESHNASRDEVKRSMIALTTQLQSKIIERIEQMEAIACRKEEESEGIIKGLFSRKDPPATKFRVDVDDRRQKGKLGITACIQGGRVVEKGGVGVTMLRKPLNPRMAKQMSNNHPDLKKALENGSTDGLNMWVNGISCIIHPVNPKAPTVHFNYRHFQITDKQNNVVAWWFGGGQDLTPIYLYEEDAKRVHSHLKNACDKHNKSYYPKFKDWADRYFYHTARQEARGIGGIFFDDLDEGSLDRTFAFVKECADAFEPSYFPVLHSRHQEKYNEKEKEWQALRHGRYVEFNLVYDRGTKFGFSVPGVNIEAVLMSLPLTVQYMYKHKPGVGSPEEKLLKTLTGKPKKWV
mmetsp:Transcript_15847/g.23883  ORF Transcript_15847/g.23883 Transcript_15847/m.23883 type:complete len:406 (-) Transcript_15847:106-1323(-)